MQLDQIIAGCIILCVSCRAAAESNLVVVHFVDFLLELNVLEVLKIDYARIIVGDMVALVLDGKT